jgi:hypothetical protein
MIDEADLHPNDNPEMDLIGRPSIARLNVSGIFKSPDRPCCYACVVQQREG